MTLRKFSLDAVDLGVLFGINDENLRSMEQVLDVRASARGAEVQLEGASDRVARAEAVLSQIAELQHDAVNLLPDQFRTACQLLDQNAEFKLRAFFVDGAVRVTAHRQVNAKSFNQKVYLESIRLSDLVFGVGPAGTGKTYLAIAMALQALTSKTKQRIILTRPAVEAGERLGFLPGDLYEKVHPYLRPLYDALHDMLDGETVQRYIARGIIEIAPIAFMRGRTLNDSFIILDEAQNTTAEQMKMFLTRIGFNAKVVVTGDVTQIDLGPGKVSGLRQASEIIRGVSGVEFVFFDDRDVVRHPLVQRIIQAYARFEAAKEEVT